MRAYNNGSEYEPSAHPTEDAFMLPPYGAQPVPPKPANDNDMRLVPIDPDLAVETFGPVGAYGRLADIKDGLRAMHEYHGGKPHVGDVIGENKPHPGWPMQDRPPPREPVRQGDWMQTYTGKKFWPLDPRPQEVDIVDIAHSLSMQCRYAGHCRKFYSVAEHSVLIARWLVGRTDAQTALYGLLHDAAEAYTVDVPRPLKRHLVGYKEAEAKVMEAIAYRFGLPLGMPEIVHEADDRIIADELANMTLMPWHARHCEPLGVNLRYWTPAEAEIEFLATFEALTGRVEREVA